MQPLPVVAAKDTAEVSEKCCAQALMAVAQVDSDAVWLLLTQLATEAAPASAASLHPLPAGAPAGIFKPFRSLMPPHRGRSALAQRGRGDGVGQRATVLLKRLEAAETPPPDWSPL